MGIRNDSQKIVQYFLTKAIEYGDLRQQITFQYDTLAATLGLESGNYCRVCCQYLKDLGYISLYAERDKTNPNSNDYRTSLTGRAIDFLESPYLGN